MGLRVNTNTSAMAALRALSITDHNQSRSLTRLATGLRLNSGADGPGDLLISDQLSGQIIGTQQALENVQLDTSMIATADGGLENIADLLNTIKDSVTFALNTATASPDAIQAQQDSVDQALAAISRQATTTQFNGKSLLDGSSDIRAVGSALGVPLDTDFDNLVIREANVPAAAAATLPAFRTVTMTNVTNPSRANITFGAFGAGMVQPSTWLITGPRGSAEFTLDATPTAAEMGTAIQAVAAQTGVVANATDAFSEETGTAQQISLKFVSFAGTVGATTTFVAEGQTMNVGDTTTSTGIDGVITVDGQNITGRGRHFDVTLPGLSMSFDQAVPSGTALAATVTLGFSDFRIEKTGLTFQIGSRTSAADSMHVGIRSVTAASLGTEAVADYTAATAGTTTKGGALTSLASGGVNSLALKPAVASGIVDLAISQVDQARAQLGALQAYTLDPQQRQLQVQIENLSAARSVVRDLNFAEETTNFTKNQILFQSGTAALASANLIPQSVLTLLR